MHSYLGGNALGGGRTSCLVAGLGAADQGRVGNAVLVVGERCGIPAEGEFHVKHGAIGWSRWVLWAGVQNGRRGRRSTCGGTPAATHTEQALRPILVFRRREVVSPREFDVGVSKRGGTCLVCYVAPTSCHYRPPGVSAV